MTPEDVRQEQGRRLVEARKQAGYRSAREAALANGWPESSYRAHEAGTRTIGQDDAERYARRFRAAGAHTTAREILFGSEEEVRASPVTESRVLPIMGYVGAGDEIDPEFEQVPQDGLEQVELPYSVPGDLIGFQVRGMSMMPKYDDGEILVVHRDQQSAIESMIGDIAVVRTQAGHRFVKRIMPGPRPHTFNLESLNAPTIVGVRIAWASPVRMTVANIGLRKRSPKRRIAVRGSPADRGR